MQIDGHQSCDEDSNLKLAASDISLGHQNGTINRQSSIRIVTLCVLAAVTFGIALGLKDGLDKASEYFAGCDLLASFLDNTTHQYLLAMKLQVPTPLVGLRVVVVVNDEDFSKDHENEY